MGNLLKGHSVKPRSTKDKLSRRIASDVKFIFVTSSWKSQVRLSFLYTRVNSSRICIRKSEIMTTGASVTSLIWMASVHLVTSQNQFFNSQTPQGNNQFQGNSPFQRNNQFQGSSPSQGSNLIPQGTGLKPGQPPAFVATASSPVREVYCQRRGYQEFRFRELPPNNGELVVKSLCEKRGFIFLRLPAPASFDAELVSEGPFLPNNGFIDPFGSVPREQQERMIALHNFQRSMVTPAAEKMFQLVFDQGFAQKADRWVARCAEGLEGSGVGENVAKFPGRVPSRKALDHAFEKWMQNPTSERQILTDEVKVMGCAFNDKCRDFSGDFTLVACYYEKFPDPSKLKPYDVGPSCAQCSECLNRLCVA